MPIGLSSAPSALSLTTFSRLATACPLGLGRSKLRARRQRDRPELVVCVHDETGALTFGHVVQHGSNVLAQY